MHKSDVTKALRELADLLEITDANPFEVMAHRNAALQLEEWQGDLSAAVSRSTLTQIPGIGKGIAGIITSLVTTGACEELDRVRQLVPGELPLLLGVSGLGPKRVRALWRELGVKGPADLQRAVEDGRLQSLRGFGAKMAERIQAGLLRLKPAEKQPARQGEEVASLTGMPLAPKARGRLLAGTSGYSYPQWKGTFYPADASEDELLRHYARRLSSVEINNTFYRFPTVKVLDQWLDQTPATFRFAIKANRRITHLLRLAESSRQTIAEFVERCGHLGSRLACILFQLPPNMPRDDQRLQTLLSSIPRGPRYALEFRHASWFDDEVLRELKRHNIACVVQDTDDGEPHRALTADFAYIRLMRAVYEADQLDFWQAWIQERLAEQRDVMVYLKHDDAGVAPELASALGTQRRDPESDARLREELARPAAVKRRRPRRKSG